MYQPLEKKPTFYSANFEGDFKGTFLIYAVGLLLATLLIRGGIDTLSPSLANPWLWSLGISSCILLGFWWFAYSIIAMGNYRDILEKTQPGNFKISGSETFKNAVERVLDDLRTKAPRRYEEAVTLLPKAEQVEYNEHGYKFGGRSDGLFTMDGSDYKRFRWVFLHEVGHNVAYKANKDHSEETANAYADMVLREMGE